MVVYNLIWFLFFIILFNDLNVLQIPILTVTKSRPKALNLISIYGMIFYVIIPLLFEGFVTRNSMSLSKQESEFLASFSAKGKTIFTFQDALEFWKTTDAATNSLGRLVKKRWLFRLENGLYMIIPLELGSPIVVPTIVFWKLQINFPGLLPKEKYKLRN